MVPLPDCAHVHRELSRPGVSRELLWHEYKSAHPDGLEYTAFCNHYRRWRASQEVVFRQVHVPGDKLFVDYAGHTMPVVDPVTGALVTDLRPDWLGSHARALIAR